MQPIHTRPCLHDLKRPLQAHGSGHNTPTQHTRKQRTFPSCMRHSRWLLQPCRQGTHAKLLFSNTPTLAAQLTTRTCVKPAHMTATCNSVDRGEPFRLLRERGAAAAVQHRPLSHIGGRSRQSHAVNASVHAKPCKPYSFKQLNYMLIPT